MVKLNVEGGSGRAELGQQWCRGAGAAVGQAGRSGRAARRSGSVADLEQQAGGVTRLLDKD